MIHPSTQVRFIDSARGYGVFATAFIPRGTIVYVKDALEVEVSPEWYDQYPEYLQQVIEKYSYIDERGLRILSWDHAKYVNHCCQCNTMSTGYGFEIAIRDIEEGEEITDEYGMFNLEYEMPLSCAQPNCRGAIRSGDWESEGPRWDAQVVEAMACIPLVDQPLVPIIDSDTWQAVQAFLAHRETYRSVLHLRWTSARKSA